MLPECLALNRFRLDRNLTWRAMATVVDQAHVDLSWRTLHYLCSHDPPARTRDRTLYQVRKLVAYIQAQGWMPPLPSDSEGASDAPSILRSHDARPARGRPRRPTGVRE